MADWYRDHNLSPECYPDSEYTDWAQDNGLYVDAAGRREYAERTGGATELEREVRDRMRLAAACCESAAKLIENPHHILDVIPSWRFTAEETAALWGKDSDGD